MPKRVKLNEAIKISVEIDPNDYVDGGSEPVSRPVQHESRNQHGGKYSDYVSELHAGSHMSSQLSEMAVSINGTMNNILESVGTRGDKRESITAEHHANGKVLREWRSFLRELAQFQARFGG